MRDFKFQVDKEVKIDFLHSKPTPTANSNGFVLKKVDDYEACNEKKVYELSISELREMLLMQYGNKSLGTISKNASIIRKYIDKCIEVGLVPHMENRMDALTRNELETLVSQQALDFKYVSPDDLRNNLDELFNPQDRGLIYAIYLGIKGRPTKDGTLEELINLQIDEKSIDYKNNILKLEKNNGNVRFIQISEYDMDILIEAKNSEEYVSNNGIENPRQRGGFRTIIINKVGNYVFRNTGESKFELMNPVLINSRMQRIQTYVGNPYLTVNSLYMSGMINMALEIKKKNGELTSEDYRNICERFDYGSGDPTKYVQVLKDTVSQYL